MSQQFAGKELIKVDGSIIRSEAEATLAVGGKTRKPVIAAGQVQGYVEAVEPSKVTCTIALDAGTDITEAGLGAIVNSALEFDCDNGQVFLISGAFATTCAELTGGEAKVKLEFQGPPAVKV
jgi:hypothetical protein